MSIISNPLPKPPMLLRNQPLKTLITTTFNRQPPLPSPLSQSQAHQKSTTSTTTTTPDPRAPPIPSSDHHIALQWRHTLTPHTIDRHPATITTSRSSGPGGQHVNKTQSKITLIYPLPALLAQIPPILHPEMERSKYATKGGVWCIQCDEFRVQRRNEEEGWLRLFEEVRGLAERGIPGVASGVQRRRVEELEKRSNLARMKMKKERASKKAGRRGDDRG